MINEVEKEGSDTGMWMLIFLLSIMADLFTLIPIAGSFFSIIFSFFIWLTYLINGYYRKRIGFKAISTGTTAFLEFIPVLDVLPFYTLSAIVNYWFLRK